MKRLPSINLWGPMTTDSKYTLAEYSLGPDKQDYLTFLDKHHFRAGYISPEFSLVRNYQLFMEYHANGKTRPYKGEFPDYESMDAEYDKRVKALLTELKYVN